MSDSKAVWKLKEAAEYLDVSEKTIYGLVNAEVFPHFRIGNRIRTTKELIDQHIVRIARGIK